MSYKQPGHVASNGNHGAKRNGQRADKGELYNKDGGTGSMFSFLL